MVLRLVPREEKFFVLLKQAADNIVTGSALLTRLFSDWADLPGRAAEMKGIEDKGDQITHDIVHLLNATFITPLDREDILTMASRLDDVIDRVEAATARLLLFRITAPTDVGRGLAETLHLSCEQVAQAIAHLQRNRFREVARCCVEINRLENVGDEQLRQGLEALFDGTHDALEVMKWKEIYETIEDAIDRCEDVSNVLEAVALKNA